ncbi:MAG TPA: histidine triad nucleotide-binding protein [Wenzhouxiangella sp.]
MSDDLFLKIIDRSIPADIVFEDDQVLAFRDIEPQAPVHILIIPKTKIETLNDTKPSDELLLGHMVHVASQIATEEGVAEAGYRLVFNCNPNGGQSVYHIHLHLLGGRQMVWPPG